MNLEMTVTAIISFPTVELQERLDELFGAY